MLEIASTVKSVANTNAISLMISVCILRMQKQKKALKEFEKNKTQEFLRNKTGNQQNAEKHAS